MMSTHWHGTTFHSIFTSSALLRISDGAGSCHVRLSRSYCLFMPELMHCHTHRETARINPHSKYNYLLFIVGQQMLLFVTVIMPELGLGKDEALYSSLSIRTGFSTNRFCSYEVRTGDLGELAALTYVTHVF